MRNLDGKRIAALSAVHRSLAGHHHGLETLSSGDGGGGDEGGEGVQERNEAADSSVAAYLRQLLVVAIGSDAHSAVPKRVRSVHDADADELCLTATGPNYHAKRLEVRRSSGDD